MPGWPSSSSWWRIVPTRPSIMSLGRDRVGAGLGVGDRGFRQQLDGDVVVDLAVADEAAVAVRGVLAEADVGDHGQVGVGLLQRPHRHLHDALVVVGAAAGLVLGRRDAEEEQRADAERSAISVASATSSEIEKRSMPGIDSTSSRTPSPATTKAGWIRCAGDSAVSRTRPRRASVRRRRRMRVAGKASRSILGSE